METIESLDALAGEKQEENELSLLRDIKQFFPDTLTNKELLANKNLVISWLIDGVLIEGGTSLLVAEPKTGKSMLARHFAYAISKGEKILNRKVKKGLVFYISVEDHPAWIKKHMKAMGSKNEDSIIWSLGRIRNMSFVEGIEYICKKIQPSFIVVDTMFKVFRIHDINEYNGMIDALQAVTEIARKYNTHIMYIHHMNKPAYKKNNDMGDFQVKSDVSLSRIMGSTGIAGEVDNILFLTKNGDARALTTLPRCGDRIEELLYWDEKRGLFLINEI